VIPRVLVIAAVAYAVIVLFTARITLPALTFVGLVAWAVLASVAALAYRRANRKESGR
jgi:hypothetical protein